MLSQRHVYIKRLDIAVKTIVNGMLNEKLQAVRKRVD